MPQWAGKVGSFLGGLVMAGIEAWQKRNDPPLRIDDLHVGATTEAAVDAERAKAASKWPDAPLSSLTRDDPTTRSRRTR